MEAWFLRFRSKQQKTRCHGLQMIGISPHAFTLALTAHIQSLFPIIWRPWHLVRCCLLRKRKNQASISSLLEGSIGSRYIITRPQKWPKTRLLGLLIPFFSKTRNNSLLPNSDSTGKNLSKSVIIGRVPKSMLDSVIDYTESSSLNFKYVF